MQALAPPVDISATATRKRETVTAPDREPAQPLKGRCTRPPADSRARELILILSACGEALCAIAQARCEPRLQ